MSLCTHFPNYLYCYTFIWYHEPLVLMWVFYHMVLIQQQVKQDLPYCHVLTLGSCVNQLKGLYRKRSRTSPFRYSDWTSQCNHIYFIIHVINSIGFCWITQRQVVHFNYTTYVFILFSCWTLHTLLDSILSSLHLLNRNLGIPMLLLLHLEVMIPHHYGHVLTMHHLLV